MLLLILTVPTNIVSNTFDISLVRNFINYCKFFTTTGIIKYYPIELNGHSPTQLYNDDFSIQIFVFFMQSYDLESSYVLFFHECQCNMTQISFFYREYHSYNGHIKKKPGFLFLTVALQMMLT